MKLISTTDFVLDQRKKQDTDNIRRFWASERYACFLKRLLKLWMFVPCDEDGNVLEDCDCISDNGCCSKRNKYQQAKERGLFEGFEMYKGNPYNEYKARAVIKDYFDENWNIERIIHWELELTPTAQKQVGL